MNATDKELIQSVIGQMGSQVDLLFTLAVAVFGGLIALIVQVILHNSEAEEGKRVHLGRRSRVMIVLALLVILLSLGAGYMARGAITETTPAMFRQSTANLDRWSDATFKGGWMLRFCVMVQIITFLVAVAFVSILVLTNMNKLGGAANADKASDAVKPTTDHGANPGGPAATGAGQSG